MSYKLHFREYTYTILEIIQTIEKSACFTKRVGYLFLLQ